MAGLKGKKYTTSMVEAQEMIQKMESRQAVALHTEHGTVYYAQLKASLGMMKEFVEKNPPPEPPNG